MNESGSGTFPGISPQGLPDSTTTAPHSTVPPRGTYLLVLSMGALGIVFGDIGTSVLYALRECFSGSHALPVTPANVLGVLSLILWTLLLVISIKYLVFVLRADSRGEGGILVLMSLLRPEASSSTARRIALTALGLFGAALLYGDGIITPAITVLSAVEGLEVVTPAFKPYIVPLTVVILVVLFVFQKKGTAKVGAVFGPVMLVWFAALAALGASQVVKAPSVLLAVNPWYAVQFFLHNGVHGFLVLGSVFLVVTGGEALYADMGHFGRRPIRVTWFAVVLPALLLNYFGQGALLLVEPKASVNPLFRMAPSWGLWPLVVLATAASVIASQAVISGAFSLTRQAIQLGYMPRLKIAHTSAREIGQIYLPTINYLLMVLCVWLVLEFRSSTNLAAAYGIAVTTTMVITTVLLFLHARNAWGLKLLPGLVGLVAFLSVDLAFFGANVVKIGHGGWFPIVVGFAIYVLMTTWKRGRELLRSRLAGSTMPVELFLSSVEKEHPTRVRGTAVFMDRIPEGVPPALLHNLKHNKVIHERVVFLTVVTNEVPHVRPKDRSRVERLGHGFWRMTLHYGFMQDPDIPRVLFKLKLDGKMLDEASTTFFLGRETLIASERPGLPPWREHLFAWMARAEGRATAFFNIPPGRVVELGLQVEL